MEISGDLVLVTAFGELMLPMMWLAREVYTHTLVKDKSRLPFGGSVANFYDLMLLMVHWENDRV